MRPRAVNGFAPRSRPIPAVTPLSQFRLTGPGMGRQGCASGQRHGRWLPGTGDDRARRQRRGVHPEPGEDAADGPGGRLRCDRGTGAGRPTARRACRRHRRGTGGSPGRWGLLRHAGAVLPRGPACGTSMRRPAGRTSARRVSPRSSACSRPGPKTGHGRVRVSRSHEGHGGIDRRYRCSPPTLTLGKGLRCPVLIVFKLTLPGWRHSSAYPRGGGQLAPDGRATERDAGCFTAVL